MASNYSQQICWGLGKWPVVDRGRGSGHDPEIAAQVQTMLLLNKHDTVKAQDSSAMHCPGPGPAECPEHRSPSAVLNKDAAAAAQNKDAAAVCWSLLMLSPYTFFAFSISPRNCP